MGVQPHKGHREVKERNGRRREEAATGSQHRRAGRRSERPRKTQRKTKEGATREDKEKQSRHKEAEKGLFGLFVSFFICGEMGDEPTGRGAVPRDNGRSRGCRCG